jgi:hypothetical protein
MNDRSKFGLMTLFPAEATAFMVWRFSVILALIVVDQSRSLSKAELPAELRLPPLRALNS